jgi:hypothetical protein
MESRIKNIRDRDFINGVLTGFLAGISFTITVFLIVKIRK